MKKKHSHIEEFHSVETDFYSEAGLDECIDNGEISDIEEGFMKGYLSTWG